MEITHRLKDSKTVANIHAWHHASSSHQSGSNVAQDVAVQVGHDQHIKLLWPRHHLQQAKVQKNVHFHCHKQDNCMKKIQERQGTAPELCPLLTLPKTYHLTGSYDRYTVDKDHSSNQSS